MMREQERKRLWRRKARYDVGRQRAKIRNDVIRGRMGSTLDHLDDIVEDDNVACSPWPDPDPVLHGILRVDRRGFDEFRPRQVAGAAHAKHMLRRDGDGETCAPS